MPLGTRRMKTDRIDLSDRAKRRNNYSDLALRTCLTIQVSDRLFGSPNLAVFSLQGKDWNRETERSAILVYEGAPILSGRSVMAITQSVNLCTAASLVQFS